MHKKKRFGQNFLVDQNYINLILDAVTPEHSDDLVEIGCGDGAITLPLQSQCRSLKVIEIDKRMVDFLLQKKMIDHSKVEFFNTDVLQIDLTNILDPKCKYKIIGNLPYNIATEIIFRLIDCKHLFSLGYIMVQKEVAERLCAQPGSKKFGKLSIFTQLEVSIDHLFDLPPNAFDPPPKVNSTFLKINFDHKNNIHIIDRTVFSHLVHKCFSMRRKKISTILKDRLNQKDWESLNIDSGLRPEDLSIQDYASMSNYLKNE